MASSIRRRSVGVIFCMLLLLAGGCHLRGDGEGATLPEGDAPLSRIAVVPFLQVLPEEANGPFVHCPLCGTIVPVQRFPGHPEQAMERLFLTRLEKAKPSFAWMAGERVAGVQRRIASASFKAPLRQVLIEAGRELGADAVVAGYLYRYRERKGAAYAVEQPAAVTFEIHLLRVADGALLWRGYYDKTQTSLLEDLFQWGTFVQGKGRWMTAEELLAAGMDQVLASFPGLAAGESPEGPRSVELPPGEGRP